MENACFTLLLTAALAALPACADTGALGQADVSIGNPAVQGANGPFDVPIAAGATASVGVEFTLRGGGAPPLSLLSGNDGIFTTSGSTITGVGPGVAELMFFAGPSELVDFTAVFVATPSALALDRLSDDGTPAGRLDGTVQLLVGEALNVSSTMMSGTETLAGTAELEWTADAAVARVLEVAEVDRRRIVAVAPGTTPITVTSLGLTQTFDVEVVQ